MPLGYEALELFSGLQVALATQAFPRNGLGGQGALQGTAHYPVMTLPDLSNELIT